jgi:hypothetical protein
MSHELTSQEEFINDMVDSIMKGHIVILTNFVGLNNSKQTEHFLYELSEEGKINIFLPDQGTLDNFEKLLPKVKEILIQKDFMHEADDIAGHFQIQMTKFGS